MCEHVCVNMYMRGVCICTKASSPEKFSTRVMLEIH